VVSVELVALKAKVSSVGGYYFIFTTTFDFLIIFVNFTMIAIVGIRVNEFDPALKVFIA
jgi:hypothetical protein